MLQPRAASLLSLAAVLAAVFSMSAPAAAPTLTVDAAGRLLDFDPLLGPWPVERMLVPEIVAAAASAALHSQDDAGAPVARHVVLGVQRLSEAWTSLRILVDRLSSAMHALRVIPARTSGPAETPFVPKYFEDLFRPQAAPVIPDPYGAPVQPVLATIVPAVRVLAANDAGPGRRGGAANIVEVMMKMTAFAFLGAVVLVPFGCAQATRSLYTITDRAVPALAATATRAGPRRSCR